MADNKDFSKGQVFASCGAPIKEAANKKKEAQTGSTPKADELMDISLENVYENHRNAIRKLQNLANILIVVACTTLLLMLIFGITFLVIALTRRSTEPISQSSWYLEPCQLCFKNTDENPIKTSMAQKENDVTTQCFVTKFWKCNETTLEQNEMMSQNAASYFCIQNEYYN